MHGNSNIKYILMYCKTNFVIVIRKIRETFVTQNDEISNVF